MLCNGLHEKSNVLVRLFESSDYSEIEKRGVVSAKINGNHKILKPNCRFGVVDPVSTLTFANRCSFIDVMSMRHFDSTSEHPLLDVSYKEVLGEKANFFLSFANVAIMSGLGTIYDNNYAMVSFKRSLASRTIDISVEINVT
jgi:hypothetical protein